MMPKNTCLKIHLLAHRASSGGGLGIILAKGLRLINRCLLSCDIGYGASIADSCQFYHNGLGCVIHDKSQVGDGCILFQNVTLGSAWRGGVCEDEAPVIESNVLLGAGCCILGPVVVGHDSIIGANAVVTTDIPPGSTVVGPHSRIITKTKPR